MIYRKLKKKIETFQLFLFFIIFFSIFMFQHHRHGRSNGRTQKMGSMFQPSFVHHLRGRMLGLRPENARRLRRHQTPRSPSNISKNMAEPLAETHFMHSLFKQTGYSSRKNNTRKA